MYNYRLKETTTWVNKLISTHESGTIIGLPMSGKLKTIESIFESKNQIDQLLVIDLSIAPKRISDFISTIQPKINQFLSSGGKVVCLENCSINSKKRRHQLKATTSIRTEMNRSFIYIYSFSEDILLKTKTLDKYNYLSGIRNNINYFPYATLSEVPELLQQNKIRFDTKLFKLSPGEVLQKTSGVPYLIKTLFRDENQLGESIRHLISEFSSSQINHLKHLTPETIKSFHKLGLLTSSGDFISTLIKQEVSNSKISLELIIDSDKQKILVGAQSIMSDLTSYEKEILFKLKKDHKISREEIAATCYGSKKSADYSDYAIDKIISRLRNNLTNLGADPSVIKTNRGFGYSLNNHDQ
ncbi:winged helix-turn-helix domain-containing protein [Candidatus Shapirobacteria bacterium]|nr:winged helix-turn-helix domain-containing protein [Candidatus Shapirobacteria bacterium]